MNESHKMIYFRVEQAQLFFERLAGVFFEEGYGLFLPKEIKCLVFELRSIFYRLYLNIQKSLKENVIAKIEQEKRIVQIREELIDLLIKCVKNIGQVK